MARPFQLSPKHLTLIAGCIFDGLTDEETALLAGVSVKRIERMRAGDECPEIKKATIQRKRHYIALIRDGDDRTNRWQRIAWFLERRYPTEFSKPEVQLSLGNASVTNNTLVITAEAAQALQRRASTVDAEVEQLVKAKSKDYASDASEPASQASNGTSSERSEQQASEPSKPRRKQAQASRAKSPKRAS